MQFLVAQVATIANREVHFLGQHSRNKLHEVPRLVRDHLVNAARTSLLPLFVNVLTELFPKLGTRAFGAACGVAALARLERNQASVFALCIISGLRHCLPSHDPTKSAGAK
jgi:hypothetical protein